MKQLQKEEERTAKAIADTIAQVSELNELRQRNQAKVAAKEAQAANTEALLQTQREEVLRAKGESRKNKLVTESKIYSEKVQQAM